MKYIAYYRVSTTRQGASGLGLEAQKIAVMSYVRNSDLIAQYTDIESGKNDSRPELLKAIQRAKDEQATLVIAKLDRLSRNLSFITTLMDSKVNFICCDMPDANPLTLHIIGALAQWERERISERTKAALDALKSRGVKLGSPVGFTSDNQKKGTIKRKEIALSNPNNIKAKKLIELLSKSGKSLRAITDELNEAGFVTSRGCKFQPETVRRLIG